MSRDRDDVDAPIVLPAGMEIVVPPAARPPDHAEAAEDGKPDSHPSRRATGDGATRRESRPRPAA
jgi:hypothetical protein